MGCDIRFWFRSLSMLVVETPADLAAGAALAVSMRLATEPQFSYVLDNPPAGLPQSCYSGITWRIEMGVVPEVRSPDFESVADAIDLQLTAGTPVRLEASLKPDRRVLVRHANLARASGQDARELSEAKSGQAGAVYMRLT